MSLDEVDGNVYILRHLRAVFCSGMIDDRARVSSCSTRKQSNKDKICPPSTFECNLVVSPLSTVPLHFCFHFSGSWSP
ncbi:hypothetical protein DTO166G4_4244 [Paecilomyces variotii]|nr:hypothetical protein DTO166G4_4244 [Paecilomyces variotii]